MSDIGCDYQSYQNARSAEGGDHQGRSDPSSQLLRMVVIVGHFLALGIGVSS